MANNIVRQNIWTLDSVNHWHPIITAYALAVGELQSRDANTADTTRWEYQSVIHSESCQHFSWFFLPWHRMYLHRFEVLIRSTIAELDDVDDETKDTWALPYWDYSSSDAWTRELPQAFRSEYLFDDDQAGRLNPLHDLTRDKLFDRGFRLDERITRIGPALDILTFEGEAGFGGPRTRWHHWGGASGALEKSPHNAVHRQLKGNMGDPVTSPLDPIFWLHHANIDRLWEVWLKRPGRANPNDADWLTEQPFWFWSSEDPGWTTFTASQVVNTSADPLNYTYEPGSGSSAIETGTRLMPTEPQMPPQLVGATSSRVQLTGDAATVSFGIGAAAGPLQDSPPARVFLAVDDVTSPGPVGADYVVYLDVPGTGAESAEDNFVGVIAPFGIESMTNDENSSMRFVFDVTALYERLAAAGKWNGEVSVRFEPVRAEAPPGFVADDEVENRPTAGVLDVGQVGVHFQ